MNICPFCKIENLWFENEHYQIVRDGFPISPGHSLVVPKQHVSSLYDLEINIQAHLWQAVAEVRRQLKLEFNPDGFNIGLNDGQPAGQTVLHAHIHIIPRYQGDVEDPRGGVRWIIPRKAKYWD